MIKKLQAGTEGSVVIIYQLLMVCLTHLGTHMTALQAYTHTHTHTELHIPAHTRTHTHSEDLTR